MSKTIVPQGYKPLLTVYETQIAIGMIKKIFEKNLSSALNLSRVSAPIFVDPLTGLNDDLNGVEKPVEFVLKQTGKKAQIVQSLAKWKRMALHKYGFSVGEGIYTDMNAVRPDEELDNLHSVYVDQWDWEKVITADNRNTAYLWQTVELIVGAICDTLRDLKELFPTIDVNLERKVTFVTSQELEDKYPHLSPEERENMAAKEYKTIFVTGIGGKLKSGIPHGSRAPDYDDWDLNGDIIFWNDILGCAFEISSMGIRVDSVSMEKQLTLSGKTERKSRMFHRMVLDGTLPLTIGGGIGQSRLSMLLLGKAHIGEVQSSVWDKETLLTAEKAGIVIL